MGERVSGKGFVNALGRPTGGPVNRQFNLATSTSRESNQAAMTFPMLTRNVVRRLKNRFWLSIAGIPLYELDIGLAFVVLCLFVGGLVPTRFVYKSINDKPNSILEDIPQLVGRISCLGLGATIAAEAITGKVRSYHTSLSLYFGLLIC